MKRRLTWDEHRLILRTNDERWCHSQCVCHKLTQITEHLESISVPKWFLRTTAELPFRANIDENRHIPLTTWKCDKRRQFASYYTTLIECNQTDSLYESFAFFSIAIEIWTKFLRFFCCWWTIEDERRSIVFLSNQMLINW